MVVADLHLSHGFFGRNVAPPLGSDICSNDLAVLATGRGGQRPGTFHAEKEEHNGPRLPAIEVRCGCCRVFDISPFRVERPQVPVAGHLASRWKASCQTNARCFAIIWTASTFHSQHGAWSMHDAWFQVPPARVLLVGGPQHTWK